MACPTLAELFDFLRGESSEKEREMVSEHLQKPCPRCRKEASRLREILELTEAPSLVAPPPWLLRQAILLFRQRLPEPSSGWLSRIPAFLIMDNWAESRLLGFRHIEPRSRQMFYRAGPYDIDILIEAAERTSGIDLLGQILPSQEGSPSCAGAHVELRQGEQVLGTTTVNELGEFIFEGIPEGVYDLRLRIQGSEIGIAGLQALLRLSEERP